MARASKTALVDELGDGSLPNRKALARLLALLRKAHETHLSLSDVIRLAAEDRLAATPETLQRQLETLTELGLLGRLPSTAAEPIYDTVPDPHSHLVYLETGQVIDLHVSAETLLAILRQALAEGPHAVEVMVRFRQRPGTAEA